MNLSLFPRAALMAGATPLQQMPALSQALGMSRLFVKRDDCTGLAFGGNKTRKLEFTMGDACRMGADVVITVGAWQSNHVRQTAAAAAKLGLRCHAVIHSPLPAPTAAYRESGNVLIDRLLGADLHWVEAEEVGAAKAAELSVRESSEGAVPYMIPLGASDGIGSLGYVACAQELLEQFDRQGVAPSHIVLATGSAGTHAGLLAGLRGSGSAIGVVGISVSEPAAVKRAKVRHVLDQLGAVLGDDAPSLVDQDIVVLDDYMGDGYGIPTAAADDALRLLARKEGILLDPVYTAKAMSGFLDLVLGMGLGAMQDPVFLHTGGTPALFAYLEHYLAEAGQ